MARDRKQFLEVVAPSKAPVKLITLRVMGVSGARQAGLSRGLSFLQSGVSKFSIFHNFFQNS